MTVVEAVIVEDVILDVDGGVVDVDGNVLDVDGVVLDGVVGGV